MSTGMAALVTGKVFQVDWRRCETDTRCTLTVKNLIPFAASRYDFQCPSELRTMTSVLKKEIGRNPWTSSERFNEEEFLAMTVRWCYAHV